MSRLQLALLAATGGAALSGRAALAQPSFSEQPGTRALGMGGALRAAATGDAAPALNPSGMSLVRSYVAEGAYQFLRKDSAHVLHASIVDSTSASNLGGALYYTYLTASPPSGVKQHGHEGGFSLSLPFGDRFALGGTLKYVRFTDEVAAAPVAPATKGFTFDVGATIRPVPTVAVAAVGYNLNDLKHPYFPVALGFGGSVNPTSDLLVAVDGVFELSTPAGGRDKAVSIMAGAEYLLAGKMAVRAGGGRDGLRDSGYLSAGLSLLSEAGSLDLGLRQDVSAGAAGTKETFLGVAARLFVPAP